MVLCSFGFERFRIYLHSLGEVCGILHFYIFHSKSRMRIYFGRFERQNYSLCTRYFVGLAMTIREGKYPWRCPYSEATNVCVLYYCRSPNFNQVLSNSPSLNTNFVIFCIFQSNLTKESGLLLISLSTTPKSSLL